LSVCVAGADATPAKGVQDGARIDAQVFADPCERPAQGIEVNGGVDLLGREAAAAHEHLMAVENVADRPPFDAEPVAEFIHGCSGLVTGDEFLDLVGVELACPPGFGPVCGRWSGFGGVWGLPEQGFQCFYLGFCIVVSSSNVHRVRNR
jgi:hypothetical protein